MKREQIYWIAVAVATAGLLCLYAFWVAPVRARAAREAAALGEKEERLNFLARSAEGLPSEAAVNDRQAYKKWLQSEVESKVKPFFDNLAGNLATPLLTAEGRAATSQQEFKAAYQTRYVQARTELEQAGAVGATLKAYFSHYGWVEGASLPDPKEFKWITFDLNLRNALLHLIAECRPTKVNHLTIDFNASRRIEGFAQARAVPVSLGLAVPPGRVMDVLQILLSAANRPGSDALPLFIQRLDVQKQRSVPAPATADVTLDLTLEVMDTSGTVAERQAARAPKTAPSGR